MATSNPLDKKLELDPDLANSPYRGHSHESNRPSLHDEEKRAGLGTLGLPVILDEDGEEQYNAPAETAKDLITEVIHVTDDPTLNPWTFRTWFLGIGLSVFGGTLATIYYFKPQTVVISTVFLAVISYVLGEAMSLFIPRKSIIGKLFNPHPFNSKEHAAIVVMGSAAANAPLAIEVLAVQKLYYDTVPSAVVGVFLIWSSQCLGYGIAGLMRRVLVYPTKMLFPYNLPLNSLLEALHGEKFAVKKKLRVFYIGFTVLFLYEIIPEYIMPVLVGVSVFCLAKRDSLLFTNLFGGSNGNEGLGILSLSFDWQYISNPNPMWYPLNTLNNNFVGYLLCIAVFTGVYYGNIWNALKFPFISQLLYTEESNGTNFVQFNQTAVLNEDMQIDMAKVAEQGLPYFASTFAVYILATNLSITATFSHLLIWNYDDIKNAWAFLTPSSLKRLTKARTWQFWKHDDSKWGGENDPETDPHYRLLLAYKDTPNWWYGILFVASLFIGLGLLYVTKSTLPWWSYFIASCGLAPICILFFGVQYAITGYNYNVQPVIQMIAGYLHPGKPMANMYFVLFGYNSVVQGQLLVRDLKFAQYAHLAPRCTLAMQLMGTLIGSIASYLMMVSITDSQRTVLLDIQGTNIWSGQAIQTFNSQAIAWGGFSKSLFQVGQRYQWVTLAFLIGFILPLPFWIAHKVLGAKWRFDAVNTALISNFIGLLSVGINSVTLAWFAVGWFSQFYLRKYRANWFIKYNYILAAAMDGGTQVLVFILSFAVFGGSGKEHKFPAYWGNNFQDGNNDYCMKLPGADAGNSTAGGG
ncbi:OPT superfamily oligopeptide transporter [Microthyrium microscopicum]|uniref:OPT superfamily oligopeptide transporter n=1 Tax=Microthyrium microscopicum TaxID=703497 RepID=A0A6A6U3F1_9PEZI|nr:OPT superfamily oligopeptide transporter [Microthyrium microscopicum]